MSYLDRYRTEAGDEVINDIQKEAEPLRGKYITHVNSTYYGGGVAEKLDSLIFLMNKIGIRAEWRTIKGSDDFFRVTKMFHNGLQGAETDVDISMLEIYEKTVKRNAGFLRLENSDAVIAHDPQVLPLIESYRKDQPWIWRCHIDITQPEKRLYEYLKRFIRQYDSMVVSSPGFQKKDIAIHQTIIRPSIDPLSDKNRELSRSEAKSILKDAGIALDKPIISQISRFDSWKDPLGVIEAHQIVRQKFDCRLVLMGNFACDDPEGVEMYKKTLARTRYAEDVVVLANVPNNDLVVNALQKISKVVIQKSIREGFALTVSEALWKGTPVVGGNTGGIPSQIIDARNGYLVSTVPECAERVLDLLLDEKKRKKMGLEAKEHVRNNFLITRNLLEYLKLLNKHLNKKVTKKICIQNKSNGKLSIPLPTPH